MSTSMIDRIEDGVRVIRYPGVGTMVKWRDDCAFCQGVAVRGYDPLAGFFPTHQAQAHCRSGRRDHCTCDGCF